MGGVLPFIIVVIYYCCHLLLLSFIIVVIYYCCYAHVERYRMAVVFVTVHENSHTIPSSIQSLHCADDTRQSQLQDMLTAPFICNIATRFLDYMCPEVTQKVLMSR